MHLKRSNPEADLQRQVATYLSAVLRPEVVWSAIGHGSALGGTQRERMMRGGILKGMGLKRGVPDIYIAWQAIVPALNAIHAYTLWLELKSETGRQSPEQRDFQTRVQAMGHVYYVCRDLSAVIMALKDCGVLTREAKR